MQYDFDKVIDRRGTYSTQWDYIQDRFGRSDILPFSISDTDFPVPVGVQQALEKRIKHPIYGYTRWNHEAYKNSIVNWFKAQNQAPINPDWIVYSPSVVFSIATFIRMKSAVGEGVAVFTPMYDAFYHVIEDNQRVLIPIRLSSAQQDYQIDWDTLETVLKQATTKILLLTNPHNPTGKVFSVQELKRISTLCRQNNVFIISDDIHKDIVYKRSAYTPITMYTTTDVVLCCSATKTFNTPGLIGSYLFVPDLSLRTRFLSELKQKNALSSASIFGIESQIAAYNTGSDYLKQLVAYLQSNFDYLSSFLQEHLPEIRFKQPEATYLAWMDVSQLGLTAEALQDKLVNTGRVGIMSGSTYGDSQYLRMNVACPISKLQEGLKRMEYAIRS
ncbi:PatB family C-S lyase [Lactiplantibacillus pentosus]|uniref:cysteine-S-conjugate beta-lyase n=4 Tax=Lactiplantibacillus pentosus TaxID=1589 RepID=A0AAX6LFG8_LACPE|nr:PatB family C-S lyase [Lactiplantibacillus pentosus]MBU7496018.1 PatB family C-S lyase [Lactiplantibacillus pentosus]MCT3283898.1 putative C-S lyase [Lactiplantibacillus pentosus]MCT3294875.1 putative C-S lyase [Lactiplantibacillus pentosus]MCT3329211.1 putative C-S lyase [Lactiplantibacillus pentosus]MDF2313321.1 PatB family C-S lyase [Lactiplantibacillus pentosus]